MRNTIGIILAIHFLFSPGPAFSQSPVKFRDTTVQGPQTFAMVVGVSKYRFVRPLKFADRDAELFRDYLRSPAGGNVKDENIFCLLNEHAITSTFWAKGFQWLKAKQLRRGDRLFLYLAGHGDAIDGDQYFFLTYDCNPAGDKNNYLAGGAIQLFNLKKKIAAETAKGVEVFLVMDACRTNELPGGVEGMNFLNTAVSEKKAGEVIMLATGAGEASLEDPSIGNGHGLFTYYLIDGLSGMADKEADHKITLREIQDYIGSNVPAIAQERFRQKQAPYFCCTEYADKIIGTVDTLYLKNWLKKKKGSNRGGGNAFPGEDYFPLINHIVADTALIETYNRFNSAVKDKKYNGEGSAEDYLKQLDTKFPGNPYTLDARSTLAVEYINAAQEKITQYLNCISDPSAKEKQRLLELGNNLEKAIAILREDEPEFAASLAGRMNFLKSAGDYTNTNTGIQFAHAGLSAEPGSAYLENQLALLFLAQNRMDSARYYAEKATRSAPKWRCATLTLSRITNGQLANGKSPVDSTKRKTTRNKPLRFGIVAGGGYSFPSSEFSPLPNDTVREATMDGAVKYEIGVLGQVALGNTVSIRPSILLSFEKNTAVFSGQRSSGAPFSQAIDVKSTNLLLQLPFIFRLSQKEVAPYFMAGPVLNLVLQDQGESNPGFSLKPLDVLGDAGLGIDIPVAKKMLVLSPEIKYTRGFLDAKESRDNDISRSLSKFTRQNLTFSLYLRKR